MKEILKNNILQLLIKQNVRKFKFMTAIQFFMDNINQIIIFINKMIIQYKFTDGLYYYLNNTTLLGLEYQKHDIDVARRLKYIISGTDYRFVMATVSLPNRILPKF